MDTTILPERPEARKVTRRSLFSGLAAYAAVGSLIGAAASTPDRCAAATRLARTKAQELKKLLKIDGKVDPNTRADWFCTHAETVVRWEDRPDGKDALAQYLETRSVLVPLNQDSEARDRSFVYYAAALLYVMEPGEMLAGSPPSAPLRALWTERHAFAKSFSKEFFS